MSIPSTSSFDGDPVQGRRELEGRFQQGDRVSTCGVGDKQSGGIILEAHGKALHGEHFGAMSSERADGSMSARVRPHEVHDRKSDILRKQIQQRIDAGELPAGTLPVSRDGTGHNEVSRLARDLAGQERGADSIKPIRMDYFFRLYQLTKGAK